MPSTSAIIFLSAAVFGVAVVVVGVIVMELPPVHTTSAQGSACRHIVIVTSTMALVVTWLTRKQNDGKGSLGLLEGLVVGGGRVLFDAQAYATVEAACKSGGVTKDLSHLKQAMTESSAYTGDCRLRGFRCRGDRHRGR